MKKIACVDIGTNSVRMIMLSPSEYCIDAKKYMKTTRIGRGVDQTRQLSDAGMKETLEALIEFSSIAKEAGVDDIYAIATSAVRDAENREVFLTQVREQAHMTVEMISGDEEARLGFLGVSKGLESDEKIMVIDIGGGSTEIIIGQSGHIDFMISLDIGAVRLTDKFVSTDPVDLNEQQDMSEFVRVTIQDVLKQVSQYEIKKVVGIGGTITTAGSMALEMDMYDRKKIHNYYVPLDRLHTMTRKLWSQSVEERKTTKGLQPKRADIIPSGYMILQQLLLGLDLQGIYISEYDNLEGLFYDKDL